jgi:type IX secretion system PorP/SprF family membrane protein
LKKEISLKVKVTIIVIFLARFLFTYGQDAIFSQFTFHQLYFNPAYAGNSPFPRTVAGYRNQWPELGNSYVSYYISYDQYFNGIKSNLGLAFNRDYQGGGTIGLTSFDVIYGYPIELNNTSFLTLGLQASIVQKSIVSSGLVLPDQNPFNSATTSESVPDRSKIFPDFSAGAAFYFHEQYLLSFAVHHINRPSRNISTGYVEMSPIQFMFQGLSEITLMKNKRTGETHKMTPGISLQLQSSLSQITWGTNFQYRSIIYGIWCRNNIKFSLTTLILQLGYTNGAMTISYSYDAWAPKNYQHFKNYGAHEVTFIYHFKYNDPKKRMKTLKCPKISR